MNPQRPTHRSPLVHFTWLALCACLLVGAYWLGRHKGLWHDELHSVKAAKRALLPERWSLSNHPPLYFVALHGWASLLDYRESWLRALSLGFSFAAVALFYRWLLNYSLGAARVGALAACLLPGFLRYSVEIRGYSLLLMATAGALGTLERLARAPSPRWTHLLGFLFYGTLALGTHPAAVFLFPTAGIFLATHPARRWTVNRKLGATALLTLAALGALAIHYTPHLQPVGWWIPALNPRTFRHALWGTLGFNETPHTWIARFPLVALTALGLAAAWGLRRTQRHLALSFLGYLGAVAAASWWILPVFWNRSLLPAVWLALALGAVGLAQIPAPIPRRFATVVTLTALASAGLQWATGAGTNPRDNWRPALEAVARLWQPGDQLLFENHLLYWEARADEYYFPVGRRERLVPHCNIGACVSVVRAKVLDRLWELRNRRRPPKLFLISRYGDRDGVLRLFRLTLPQVEPLVPSGEIRVWVAQTDRESFDRISRLTPDPSAWGDLAYETAIGPFAPPVGAGRWTSGQRVRREPTHFPGTDPKHFRRRSLSKGKVAPGKG